MSVQILNITPGQMTLEDLRALYSGPCTLSLAKDCWAGVEESAATVQQIIDDHKTVYGINTGFGRLAQEVIPENQLEKLQRNLVLSHSTGTGRLLDDNIVRIIVATKAASLGRGFSGVRPRIIEALLALLEHQIYPAIPGKGSVGASGDLTPLAH